MKTETAGAGDGGIGEQRDIGDSVTLAGEPRMSLEVTLHQRKRTVSELVQSRQFGAARRIGWSPSTDETRHCDVRLMAVLLEEHPSQRLGALPWIIGKERRARGQEIQDGVGLCQPPPVFQLDHP